MEAKRFRHNQNADERLVFIEHIIQSKVKYTQLSNICNLVQFPNLLPNIESKKVYCKTVCNEIRLQKFLSKFGDCKVTWIHNKYEIVFRNTENADLCAISSNHEFLFIKSRIYTSFEVLKKLSLQKNVVVDGTINENMPLDYYRLILGPLLKNSCHSDIINLKKALNLISPLFALRKCKNTNFFVVMFKDQSIVSRILEIISLVKIKTNPKFCIKYAYENSIITRIPSIFSMPFVSSFEPTLVVFAFNANFTGHFLESVFPGRKLEMKLVNNILYILCPDLETSAFVYNKLGGLQCIGSTIVSGYYPEFNYSIEDFM